MYQISHWAITGHPARLADLLCAFRARGSAGTAGTPPIVLSPGIGTW